MPEPVIDWSFFSMASYLLTAQADDDRVMDGSEWERLLEVLGTAGKLAVEYSPSGSVERASALRGLLHMIYFGLERTLGSADPTRPVFSRPWPVHLFDYGAGNPDAVYRTVGLRDDVTYRITGRLGSAAFASFEFFDGVRQTGSLLVSDLRPDGDGCFEVLIGPDEQPGNWLAVVPGTSYLLTREFFADWSSAVPARLEIECLDGQQGPWPVLSADRVTKEFEALGQWLVETVRTFGAAHEAGLRGFANAFKPSAVRAGSDLPTIYHGYWDLGPDECLLIETPAPQGGYWGFQLANSLFNTLDFANRQTSLNRAQAHVDDDGMLRLVVAHEDPGVANWLDTLKHQRGGIHARISPVRGGAEQPGRTHRDMARTVNAWMSDWERAADGALPPGVHAVPTARVVPRRNLDAELPTSTMRVDPDRRREVVDERLRQVTRMQRG